MSNDTILQRTYRFFLTGQYHMLILEFVVVAVGIFVGFQVDRWYEERQNSQKVDQYVQRLIFDIETDLDSLGRVLDASNFRLFATDLLISSLNDHSVPSERPDIFIRALEQATYRLNLVSSNATFSELLSTGDMSLLPTTLRSRLHEYYGSVASRGQFDSGVANVQVESYRRFAGILLPAQIERAARRSRDQGQVDPFSQEEAMAASERFRANKGAVEWLPRLRISHISERRAAERFVSLAEQLKLQLEQTDT